MMNTSFVVPRLPRVEFGFGRVMQLPGLIARYGRRALLVTGARSFIDHERWALLREELRGRGIEWKIIHIPGEPSPMLVDEAVKRHSAAGFDCVVGIGGGSALDTAKAIAGLLIPGNSVMDHLEGVGLERPYAGPATPFIAVPTTAGTGSEATKNAVLSIRGENGFKKSFRDDRLVAEYAVIDPDLLATCPPAVIATNGMDACTQLLESYVSSRSNPFTDALALSGLAAVRDALLPWYEGHGDLAAHRAGMAYAAWLSGVTLAQAGLGSVHGLASPLGAFFPIPHGVVCGALLAEATRVNIEVMRQRAPGHPGLARYADVGRLMTGRPLDDTQAHAALIRLLEAWTDRLHLPRLAAYGVTEADVERIARHSRGSSMKTNPIELTDAEIARVVQGRI